MDADYDRRIDLRIDLYEQELTSLRAELEEVKGKLCRAKKVIELRHIFEKEENKSLREFSEKAMEFAMNSTHDQYCGLLLDLPYQTDKCTCGLADLKTAARALKEKETL